LLRGLSLVRYVLVEGDSLFVGGTHDQSGGAVVSVYSSPLAAWETLPFRALDTLMPGCLQLAAIASALQVALESPLLVYAEEALRAADKFVLEVYEVLDGQRKESRTSSSSSVVASSARAASIQG